MPRISFVSFTLVTLGALALLGPGAHPAHAQYAFTRIADTTSGDFRSFFTHSINDSGQVAFRARLGGGDQGIFVGDGGAFVTIADATGPLDALRDPSVNAGGQVAFHSLLDAGGEGIVTGISGSVFSFRDPILNDAGVVAFRARRGAGRRGVHGQRRLHDRHRAHLRPL